MNTTPILKAAIARGWAFEIDITEGGDLVILVNHPVDGGSRAVEIFVDRQLGVVHDSHCDEEVIKEQYALLPPDTMRQLRQGTTPQELSRMLSLCEESGIAAQHLLRSTQGYQHETRVQFGEASYWRLRGVVCNTPPPVPHKVAAAVMCQLLRVAMAPEGEYTIEFPGEVLFRTEGFVEVQLRDPRATCQPVLEGAVRWEPFDRDTARGIQFYRTVS